MGGCVCPQVPCAGLINLDFLFRRKKLLVVGGSVLIFGGQLSCPPSTTRDICRENKNLGLIRPPKAYLAQANPPTTRDICNRNGNLGFICPPEGRPPKPPPPTTQGICRENENLKNTRLPQPLPLSKDPIRKRLSNDFTCTSRRFSLSYVICGLVQLSRISYICE